MPEAGSWHPSQVAQVEVATIQPSSTVPSSPQPSIPEPSSIEASGIEPSGTVLLGDREGHVAISFHRTRRADADDEGWVPPLLTTVTVATGSFSGSCAVSVREEELLAFRRQLVRLCESEEHEAVLTSVEERLCVRVRVLPQGCVVVQGHVSDDLRDGNTLVFAVRGLDPGCLLAVLRELREVGLELGIRAAASTHVEVRSRFDGSWVPGYEVAEVRGVDAERLFRLRRCSDGLVLPTLFDAGEVRTPVA